MKKVLMVAAITLVLGISLTGKVLAQQVKYGTEVCVNASNVEEAKRLFPGATIHVIPDSNDPNMNGWRIVSGAVGPDGKIMTDAEEIKLRRHESFIRRGERGN